MDLPIDIGERRLYHEPNLNIGTGYKGLSNPTRTNGDPAPNLIGSRLVRPSSPVALHRPVIDMDYPIMAVPSRTPGHHHLYIDKNMTWLEYQILLKGLYGARLIERTWYEQACYTEESFVRLPRHEDMYRALSAS